MDDEMFNAITKQLKSLEKRLKKVTKKRSAKTDLYKQNERDLNELAQRRHSDQNELHYRRFNGAN
jgi:ribosome-associated translation inhibitor RaiA